MNNCKCGNCGCNPCRCHDHGYSPASVMNPKPEHYGKPCAPCKNSYIGAPVKSVMHACEYCHCGGAPKNGCSCGCHSDGNCGTTIVVDDANDKVYVYGKIVHENYHVPGGNCVPYTTVAGAGFDQNGRSWSDEFFEGVQDNNNILLEHTPIVDDRFLVFLNGLKQRMGAEHDFTVEGNQLHFNFYELIPTDIVEVMYEYGEV